MSRLSEVAKVGWEQAAASMVADKLNHQIAPYTKFPLESQRGIWTINPFKVDFLVKDPPSSQYLMVLHMSFSPPAETGFERAYLLGSVLPASAGDVFGCQNCKSVKQPDKSHTLGCTSSAVEPT